VSILGRGSGTLVQARLDIARDFGIMPGHPVRDRTLDLVNQLAERRQDGKRGD